MPKTQIEFAEYEVTNLHTKEIERYKVRSSQANQFQNLKRAIGKKHKKNPVWVDLHTTWDYEPYTRAWKTTWSFEFYSEMIVKVGQHGDETPKQMTIPKCDRGTMEVISKLIPSTWGVDGRRSVDVWYPPDKLRWRGYEWDYSK